MIGHQLPGFFTRRWHGDIALPVLFWRDMLLVGTLVNLAASIAAMIVAATGAPLAIAVAVHFAPLPYNLFLFLAVTRHGASALVSIVSMAWLVAATLL